MGWGTPRTPTLRSPAPRVTDAVQRALDTVRSVRERHETDQARLVELESERQKIALLAHLGDHPAIRRCVEIQQEAVEIHSRIETFPIVLREGEKRLTVAQREASDAAVRQRAKDLRAAAKKTLAPAARVQAELVRFCKVYRDYVHSEEGVRELAGDVTRAGVYDALRLVAAGLRDAGLRIPESLKSDIGHPHDCTLDELAAQRVKEYGRVADAMLAELAARDAEEAEDARLKSEVLSVLMSGPDAVDDFDDRARADAREFLEKCCEPEDLEKIPPEVLEALKAPAPVTRHHGAGLVPIF